MVARPDETQPRLLVLGAGPAQIGLLESAKAHGIWTAVCDRDPGAPGFAFADRRCIVSIEDEPAIERLASALSLSGLIAPGRDRSTAVAARIADKLGIPHPLAPATASLGANRARQREVLAAAGVPQPRWQVASASEGEISLQLPLVIKVVDRAGQTDLRFVDQAGELARELAAARELSRGGPVLVEEFLDGPEVSVSGFSVAGEYVPLLVTDRVCAERPAFGVPLSESWPSPHAQSSAEVARRAVEALGIVDGPSHARLRVSRGGPEVLQVSARLGANHEAELVELATGVDLNRLALSSALAWEFEPGELAERAPAALGGATIRFLIAPAGVLESVEVPQGLNGVVRTWLYRQPGYRFGPLRRPSDRAGAVLVAGASREEAVGRADSASERIRFVTSDAQALV
jgi:biotin carboxylase